LPKINKYISAPRRRTIITSPDGAVPCRSPIFRLISVSLGIIIDP
jgi:hypothetical protein